MALGHLGLRLLQRFESLVVRVEFGDRGIDIFDVEPHLEVDASLLVETDHLEHLVLRRPGTDICGAGYQAGEGKTLAAHGDGGMAVAHHARRQEGLHVLGPLGRGDLDPREADDLPPTFDGHGRGE